MSPKEKEYFEQCECVASQVLHAYREGEANGGSIDWDDLNVAYQIALEAEAMIKEIET